MEKAIFIFGCCNSGTTVLWRALKRHNSLSGPDMEGQDLEDLPPSMQHYLGDATFRLWAHPKFKLAYYRTEKDYRQEDAENIREVYGRFSIPGTRFIAKSPADTLRARLIQAYFPDAYFIAIVRNGYAVSEGIVRKRKHDPDRPKFKGLFTSIDEAAQQWLVANTVIVSHQKFLRKYLIIKYEDLVGDPRGTFSTILGFLDLDDSDFSYPTFEPGLNEAQISRLSNYEIETITQIAAPMLLHFEYELFARELKWGII